MVRPGLTLDCNTNSFGLGRASPRCFEPPTRASERTRQQTHGTPYDGREKTPRGTDTMRTRPRRRRRAALGGVALGLAAMQRLPAATAAHVFPYVPTQILMPSSCWNESACGGADVAYVFSQAESGRVQFMALNYSGSVAAESQLVSLTTELPFLKGETETTAFGAARASDGSVVVYAGACDGAAGSVWSYTTTVGGEWSRRMTTPRRTTRTRTRTTTTTTWASAAATTTDSGSGGSADDSDDAPGGPSFLGGTVAFSARLAPTMDQPTIYTYGGMCAEPGADAKGWQSGANYTTRMMSLAPVNRQAADTAYSLGVV
ncbi:hypothetical protein E4U42_007055, partial [Claviceps africana]